MIHTSDAWYKINIIELALVFPRLLAPMLGVLFDAATNSGTAIQPLFTSKQIYNSARHPPHEHQELQLPVPTQSGHETKIEKTAMATSSPQRSDAMSERHAGEKHGETNNERHYCCCCYCCSKHVSHTCQPVKGTTPKVNQHRPLPPSTQRATKA